MEQANHGLKTCSYVGDAREKPTKAPLHMRASPRSRTNAEAPRRAAMPGCTQRASDGPDDVVHSPRAVMLAKTASSSSGTALSSAEHPQRSPTQRSPTQRSPKTGSGKEKEAPTLSTTQKAASHASRRAPLILASAGAGWREGLEREEAMWCHDVHVVMRTSAATRKLL